MALTSCEIAPVVLQGANIDLQICNISVPVDKVDIKRHAKKTEITSTASYETSTGSGVVWEEFAPGSSGGSVSWDGHWRVSQVIQPPHVIPGKVYPCKAYAQRGTALVYTFNAFIDDCSLTLDPKSGVITWKVSATATGKITDPAP